MLLSFNIVAYKYKLDQNRTAVVLVLRTEPQQMALEVQFGPDFTPHAFLMESNLSELGTAWEFLSLESESNYYTMEPSSLTVIHCQWVAQRTRADYLTIVIKYAQLGKICILHIESLQSAGGLTPWSFSLWGNSAHHCAAKNDHLSLVTFVF